MKHPDATNMQCPSWSFSLEFKEYLNMKEQNDQSSTSGPEYHHVGWYDRLFTLSYEEAMEHCIRTQPMLTGYKVREQDFFSVLATYDAKHSENIDTKEIFERVKKVYKGRDISKMLSIDQVEFTTWSDSNGEKMIVGRMVNNELTRMSKKIKENIIDMGIPAWCKCHCSPCINELIPYLAIFRLEKEMYPLGEIVESSPVITHEPGLPLPHNATSGIGVFKKRP